jgi:hypothetical protein
MTFATISALFVASRLFFLTVVYVASKVIARGGYYQNASNIFNKFFIFDSTWYFTVVEKGYYYNIGSHSNINFFPVYPMLVKMIASVTGYPLIVGYVVSNVALLFCGVVLFLLARDRFNDEKYGYVTVSFLFLFPVSFFYSMVYTEAVFLLFSSAAYYMATKNRFLRAWFLAYLAGATRMVGILLAVPLFLRVVQDHDPSIGRASVVAKAMLLAMAPWAGLASYFLFLYYQFDDFFAFFSAHKLWHGQFDPLFSCFKEILFWTWFDWPVYYRILFWITAIFVLFITGYMVKIKMELPLVAYAVLSFLVYYMSTTPESIPRYISVVFPIYPALAHLALRSRMTFAVCFAGTSLLFVWCSTLIGNGYWFT